MEQSYTPKELKDSELTNSEVASRPLIMEKLAYIETEIRSLKASILGQICYGKTANNQGEIMNKCPNTGTCDCGDVCKHFGIHEKTENCKASSSCPACVEVTFIQGYGARLQSTLDMIDRILDSTKSGALQH